ncbi:SPOR domain-containing protein [Metabacillus herbersteinensis]|uniref:SPOR domain-containing protein n=1 Tax=Metabacillus herbersteinensis TaxID=283816 RepID=A0ABV6G9M2_9BACI
MTTTALQLYAVQAGKFSAKPGADTVVTDLKSQGFAGSVIEEDGAFYVFAGVGSEKAQTEAINTLLIGKLEIEPWGGKTFSVELPEQFRAHVGSLSSIAAKATSGQSTDATQIADIETKLNAIETKDEAISALKEQLLAATSLLKEPSLENGWKAQQALLDAISSAKNK